MLRVFFPNRTKTCETFKTSKGKTNCTPDLLLQGPFLIHLTDADVIAFQVYDADRDEQRGDGCDSPDTVQTPFRCR